jgi:hypothetical protein
VISPHVSCHPYVPHPPEVTDGQVGHESTIPRQDCSSTHTRSHQPLQGQQGGDVRVHTYHVAGACGERFGTALHVSNMSVCCHWGISLPVVLAVKG